MQLLQELDREEMTQSLRDAKLTILSGLLLGHERREEEELFPLVKELATTEYLNEVGTQMRIQKKETDPEEVLYPGEEEQKEKFFSRVRNSPPA
jgi:hypothetical protein